MVEQGHAYNLPIKIHANFDHDSVRSAMTCGADTLEHGCVYVEVDSSVRRAFWERGGLYCPMRSVLHHLLASANSLRANGAEAFVEKVR